MSRKICMICGNSFGTCRSNAKYCSKACRYKAHSTVRKQWEKNNPDYMKNYMRNRRAETNTN